MLLYVSLFSPFRPLVHRECMYCRSIVHIVVFALSHSFSFSPVRFSSFRILSIKPSTRFFFWLPTKYLASIYTYIPSIHSFHFPFTKICGCFNLCAWVTIWFFGHVWIWVWVCVNISAAGALVCVPTFACMSVSERENEHVQISRWLGIVKATQIHSSTIFSPSMYLFTVARVIAVWIVHKLTVCVMSKLALLSFVMHYAWIIAQEIPDAERSKTSSFNVKSSFCLFCYFDWCYTVHNLLRSLSLST